MKSSVLSEDLLCSARNFMLSGEVDSRYITSDEYDSLILKAEDIVLVNTYSRQLTTLHQWKDKLTSQYNEDDSVDGNEPSPCLSLGIWHDYNKEKSFITHFNCCLSEVYYVLRICSDLTKHLYPHSKIEYCYMHLPLIGQNETSNEGMMLANASLLEILGLLIKQDNRQYKIGPNASERIVMLLRICVDYSFEVGQMFVVLSDTI